MIVEGLRVRNYKALRDVRLTKMPRMAVFVGANGSGKSTLLDVFAFLQECVQVNVESAAAWRGGTDELFTRGTTDPMEISLWLRAKAESPLLEYTLVLQRHEETTVVVSERLVRTETPQGPEETVFDFKFGKGQVASEIHPSAAREEEGVVVMEFDLLDALALTVLGRMSIFPTVIELRRAIEEWHCTTAVGLSLRSLPLRSQSRALSPDGANIADVVQNLRDQHPDAYGRIARRLVRFVSGLRSIEPFDDEGRIKLRLTHAAFDEPQAIEWSSEGTRKLLALLVMLGEPSAHPLLTYEEPENDLYPAVMWPLAEEFRAYADRGSQVLISTHSPDFVNALNLDEVYWMEKRDGFAHVVRAKDDPNVASQSAGGALLGSLWTEGFFGKADPR